MHITILMKNKHLQSLNMIFFYTISEEIPEETYMINGSVSRERPRNRVYDVLVIVD